MHLRTAAIFAIILASVLTSCIGDDAESPTRAATPESSAPTPAPAATSNPSLESALLTPDDLGSDWQSQSLEGATAAKGYYCGEEIEKPPPSALAFLYNLGEQATAFEVLWLYTDEEAARTAMKEERAGAEGCDTQLTTDGVAATTVQIEVVDFPEFGDEVFVLKTTEEPTDTNAPDAGYSMLVRNGSTILGLSITAPGTIEEKRAMALLEVANARLVNHLENAND